MAFVCNIDLFGAKLPAKEELWKLSSLVNSSEANIIAFAEDAKAAVEKGNNLAGGIAFAIVDKNEEALEALKKAKGGDEKKTYLAWVLRKLKQYDKALKTLEKVDGSDMEKVAILRDADQFDKAQEILDANAELENVSADYHYEKARLFALTGEHQSAIDNYEKAVELDPSHQNALFNLAYACDLWGNEEAAMDYYKKLVSQKPVYVSALLNLAVLYEEHADYSNALNCIMSVLDAHPNNPRANLFYKDVKSAMTMYYDEDSEKRQDVRNQILEIPISDFELSVRSRNCLKKMNIYTLGDLARIPESELLSYKNFGETSLKEIKHIIEIKGLKLGLANNDREVSGQESDYSVEENELYGQTVDELELSVRARNALDRLGVRMIGDLVRRTEAELLGCKNFGVTSLNEIKIALEKMGLSLRTLD